MAPYVHIHGLCRATGHCRVSTLHTIIIMLYLGTCATIVPCYDIVHVSQRLPHFSPSLPLSSLSLSPSLLPSPSLPISLSLPPCLFSHQFFQSALKRAVEEEDSRCCCWLSCHLPDRVQMSNLSLSLTYKRYAWPCKSACCLTERERFVILLYHYLSYMEVPLSYIYCQGRSWLLRNSSRYYILRVPPSAHKIWKKVCTVCTHQKL